MVIAKINIQRGQSKGKRRGNWNGVEIKWRADETLEIRLKIAKNIEEIQTE